MQVFHEARQNQLNDLTVDEVEEWLKSAPGGGEQVAKAAKAAGVDGRVLQELDTAAWVELGVTVALRRSKLAAAVKQKVEGKEPQRPAQLVVPPADVSSPMARTPSFMRQSQPGDDDTLKINCRCAIQNLTIHNFAVNSREPTFEAYVKFEASWEDRSPILKELMDAGFNLDDRIVTKKCTYNKLVVLGPDGSECNQLCAPRMYVNRGANSEPSPSLASC